MKGATYLERDRHLKIDNPLLQGSLMMVAFETKGCLEITDCLDPNCCLG